MKTTALAILTTILALIPTAAHAATPSQALASLAQQATHGWTDDTKPLPVLERKLNHGQRVYITCGTISRLAVRKLNRMGVQARLAGSYTFDTPNGYDDGHIMIEARINGRWQVYDLDNNRKPVNTTGHGINVRTFVAQKHRQYQIIATDKPADYTGHPDLKARFGWVYDSPANLEKWYDHILGVPTIETAAGWSASTTDPRMFASMTKLGYHMLTAAEFAALEA